MSSKVVVTGATGFLGRQICKAFEKAEWAVVGTGFSRASSATLRRLDLTDHSAVSELIEQERPQVIIHSAASRFPDKVDGDPVGARKLNVDASRNLARAAVATQSLVIYISTDYVFPGKEGEAPYEVDAPPGPTNLYGRTKLDGEQAILTETENTGLGVVLRVPVLYGPAETPAESAINVLVDAVHKAQKSDQKISMDDWAQRYPTNTEDVGRVCKDVATKYLSESEQSRKSLPKILQFSSEDRMTKYEFCKMIATEIFNVKIDNIVPSKAGNDPNASVQRPYDTHLSTQVLKELNIPIWTQDFKAWCFMHSGIDEHVDAQSIESKGLRSPLCYLGMKQLGPGGPAETHTS